VWYAKPALRAGYIAVSNVNDVGSVGVTVAGYVGEMGEAGYVGEAGEAGRSPGPGCQELGAVGGIAFSNVKSDIE